ncbi:MULTISPECIES: hypothetical protein [unclassified Chryseobacterium]|uniref:hypothetical protein n=1 Tax=unclassified Chryseobacterium TaxID=2593645 RepID=UPI0028536FD8|nr:hypothetical protein [Chryseobacterium sp. CFS7]MDR4892253.1 hypothetical protein [Chryseobacterium sp. CFS7]
MEEDIKLLDQFAGHALQALIAKSPFFDVKGELGDKIEVNDLANFKRELTKTAFVYAEWMLIARGEAIEWIKNSPKFKD